MALSRPAPEGDQRLVRYLLGQLPDAEAECLDEASIVEDDVAARLRMVENDLVDAYVAGTLDRTTRERFESHYLASPLRRNKVAAARRFLDAVDRAPIAPTRSRWFAWRTGGRLALIAAAVVLLAVGFAVEDLRLRQQVDNARRTAATLSGEMRNLARELDEQRGAGAAARSALDRLRAARPAPTALVLLPQTRAVGPVPTIAVPATATVVTFDLRLEAQDFSRYRVALKDPATGGTVWHSEPLKPGALNQSPAITVAVPANVLRPQHYSFDLVGLSSGASDTLAAYTFQIERR
jgi:hypothetical protein